MNSNGNNLPLQGEPSSLDELSIQAQCAVDAIWFQPGCSMNHLTKSTNLSWRACRTALDELVAQNLVLAVQAGGKTHLMPHAPGIQECWRQVVLLARRDARRFYTEILRRKTVSLNDLFHYAYESSGWSPAVVRKRLYAMKQCQLLERATTDLTDLRHASYQALPPHPVAAKLLKMQPSSG